MLLFRPSKPLRGRFLRIFGPSRPLKPRFSLERVVVFEVFTIFSSHSLLSLSLVSFRPIFGSSGHLPASSREAFFWPEGERENYPPPLSSALVPKVPSHLPNGAFQAPKRPQNLLKSCPKCDPEAPNLASTELLFIVIPPSSFSTT